MQTPTIRITNNLPFLSKILEKKTVAAQVYSHLIDNHLFEQFQPGFRPFHRAETALVKITSDLLMAVDSELLIILVLLGLSSAFDTISYDILLERSAFIGIIGTPLTWFKSYLSVCPVNIQGDKKFETTSKNALYEFLHYGWK